MVIGKISDYKWKEQLVWEIKWNKIGYETPLNIAQTHVLKHNLNQPKEMTKSTTNSEFDYSNNKLNIKLLIQTFKAW